MLLKLSWKLLFISLSLSEWQTNYIIVYESWNNWKSKMWWVCLEPCCRSPLCDTWTWKLKISMDSTQWITNHSYIYYHFQSSPKHCDLSGDIWQIVKLLWFIHACKFSAIPPGNLVHGILLCDMFPCTRNHGNNSMLGKHSSCKVISRHAINREYHTAHIPSMTYKDCCTLVIPTENSQARSVCKNPSCICQHMKPEDACCSVI